MYPRSGQVDLDTLSAEELERYAERRLSNVVDEIRGGEHGRRYLWQLEQALDAIGRLRHVGRQQGLFEVVSAPRSAPHAVDPIGRYDRTG